MYFWRNKRCHVQGCDHQWRSWSRFYPGASKSKCWRWSRSSVLAMEEYMDITTAKQKNIVTHWENEQNYIACKTSAQKRFSLMYNPGFDRVMPLWSKVVHLEWSILGTLLQERLWGWQIRSWNEYKLESLDWQIQKCGIPVYPLYLKLPNPESFCDLSCCPCYIRDDPFVVTRIGRKQWSHQHRA